MTKRIFHIIIITQTFVLSGLHLYGRDFSNLIWRAGREDVQTCLSDVEGREVCKGEGRTGGGVERKVETCCVEA